MKPASRKFYEVYLVVEGNGEFPVDMLRYDSAFPAQECDTSAIGRHETRRVVLCRRSVNQEPGTPDRWRSFTWKIIHAATELFEARDVANGRQQPSFVDADRGRG